MKRFISARQAVFISKRLRTGIGFRGHEGQVYCLPCLVKSTLTESEIIYNEKEPISKASAYKENFCCEVCNEPLLQEKYKKFLDRVKK